VPIQSARATAVEDLLAAARLTGIPAVAATSVAEGLAMAAERAVNGVVVVSGSVYLVGAARTLLMSAKSGPE
jgi:dihydrofolate synthase / folylpolyglutamate synthase